MLLCYADYSIVFSARNKMSHASQLVNASILTATDQRLAAASALCQQKPVQMSSLRDHPHPILLDKQSVMVYYTSRLINQRVKYNASTNQLTTEYLDGPA